MPSIVVISSPSCVAAKTQARIHAPAIHMHRARAALAVVAALLGAGEVQMLAHAVEQRGAWIDIQFVSSYR